MCRTGFKRDDTLLLYLIEMGGSQKYSLKIVRA